MLFFLFNFIKLSGKYAKINSTSIFAVCDTHSVHFLLDRALYVKCIHVPILKYTIANVFSAAMHMNPSAYPSFNVNSFYHFTWTMRIIGAILNVCSDCRSIGIMRSLSFTFWKLPWNHHCSYGTTVRGSLSMNSRLQDSRLIHRPSYPRH